MVGHESEADVVTDVGEFSSEVGGGVIAIKHCTDINYGD
jgi:hypothetical protein